MSSDCAMEREQFSALVSELETVARTQPARYRRCVGWLAALGYAYVLFILGSLLTLLGLLVWGFAEGHLGYIAAKPLILLAVPIIAVFQALWVKLPTPEGIELTQTETPALFAMLDDVAARLNAARPHKVLLNDDFNAAIVQIPRYGLLGGETNYLILGLPYLQGSPPEHVRGTVAHELGHLSGNHGRFAGKMYRLRQMWAGLLTQLKSDNNWALLLFVRFFNWYAPFFSAYSFVLARADEYVADRCEVDVVGARNAAESLLSIEIRARFLHGEIWPAVYKQVYGQPEPPPDVFAHIAQQLQRGPAPGQATLWLRQAFRRKTDFDDTHPALTDRLAALGYVPDKSVLNPDASHPSLTERLDAMGVTALEASDGDTRPSVALTRNVVPADYQAAPIEVSAATQFLQNREAALTHLVSERWRRTIAGKWHQRHARAVHEQQLLAWLDGKALAHGLTEEEAWQRADLTETYRSPSEAIDRFREMQQFHPDDPRILISLGRLLLEQNDAGGIALLEAAMQREPQMTLPACEAIYAYLRRQGRIEEADTYRTRWERYGELMEKSEEERARFTNKDTYRAAALPPAQIAALCLELSRLPRIRYAYLVQKQVSTFSERPCWLLAFQAGTFWNNAYDASLVKAIQRLPALPEGTAVYMLTRPAARLDRKLKTVSGARIYTRSR